MDSSPPIDFDTFRRVIRRGLARRSAPHIYTTHLLYESILAMPDEPETVQWKQDVVCRALKEENALLTLPFSNLLYSLGDLLLMPSLWERYLDELRNMLRHAVCSPEGAWLHPAKREGEWAILIDGFQEEASRLAKGAKLMRAMAEDSGSARFWETSCMEQFKLHEGILRNPKTGLWHNGRGWIRGNMNQLSPGAWSRGHGWLVRGLVESLEVLPRDGEAFFVLHNMLTDLSKTLLGLRNADGMWHVLLHRSHADSRAESSGSALIAAAWLKAVRLDLLPESCRDPALQTAETLASRFVDPDGQVLSVSPGPGPLESEVPYLNTPLTDGDPHGDLAIGFLLAECLRLPADIRQALSFSEPLIGA
jgi:rhamnogalacturonyl hydrolase YesR